MITRQQYLDSLIAYKDSQSIKIIAGLRRSGKSTIMASFHNYLVGEGVPQENIISLSFEMMEFDKIMDQQGLYELIKGKQPASGKCYLLLDEIQMVKNWEKVVSSLYAEAWADIYLTVSNSFLQKSGLADFLSGRYVLINVLPLSFQEYLHFILYRRQDEDRQYNSLRRMTRKFIDQGENLELDLKRYVRYGGLPTASFLPPQRRLAQEFLEGVYNSVLVKDVLIDENIHNIDILRKIARYMAENTGQIISPVIASSYLKGYYQNEDYSEETVAAYMLMLEKAYIFYRLSGYDIKTKEIMPDLNKYYVVDTGLRNMILSFSDAGKGHNIETIVYFELLRRGYEVYCAFYEGAEIDFYAVYQGEGKYFQVVADFYDKEVRDQKTCALESIPEACEKVVVTREKRRGTNDSGLIFVSYADFLLDSNL